MRDSPVLEYNSNIIIHPIIGPVSMSQFNIKAIHIHTHIMFAAKIKPTLFISLNVLMTWPSPPQEFMADKAKASI